jgi:DNA-binding beta-propeller fold protein YncE
MTPCTSIVAATRRSCDGIDEVLLSLKTLARIEINGSANSRFDHGAFDPKTRRVFVANTGLDRVEVIDYDAARHLTTLQGFPEAAGVVADEGHVAIADPGLVQSIDPRTGGSAEVKTAIGAKTTALVPPDRLYVFSPAHGGVVVLGEEPGDGLKAASVRPP